MHKLDVEVNARATRGVISPPLNGASQGKSSRHVTLGVGRSGTGSCGPSAHRRPRRERGGPDFAEGPERAISGRSRAGAGGVRRHNPRIIRRLGREGAPTTEPAASRLCGVEQRRKDVNMTVRPLLLMCSLVWTMSPLPAHAQDAPTLTLSEPGQYLPMRATKSLGMRD